MISNPSRHTGISATGDSNGIQLGRKVLRGRLKGLYPCMRLIALLLERIPEALGAVTLGASLILIEHNRANCLMSQSYSSCLSCQSF